MSRNSYNAINELASTSAQVCLALQILWTLLLPDSLAMLRTERLFPPWEGPSQIHKYCRGNWQKAFLQQKRYFYTIILSHPSHLFSSQQHISCAAKCTTCSWSLQAMTLRNSPSVQPHELRLRFAATWDALERDISTTTSNDLMIIDSRREADITFPHHSQQPLAIKKFTPFWVMPSKSSHLHCSVESRLDEMQEEPVKLATAAAVLRAGVDCTAYTPGRPLSRAISDPRKMQHTGSRRPAEAAAADLGIKLPGRVSLVEWQVQSIFRLFSCI